MPVKKFSKGTGSQVGLSHCSKHVYHVFWKVDLSASCAHGMSFLKGWWIFPFTLYQSCNFTKKCTKKVSFLHFASWVVPNSIALLQHSHYKLKHMSFHEHGLNCPTSQTESVLCLYSLSKPPAILAVEKKNCNFDHPVALLHTCTIANVTEMFAF